MDSFNPKHLPIEVIMALVSILGGIARYLNGYLNGGGFKLSLFISSIIVSGFGGLMFGWLGLSMSLPDSILFVMSGIGAYFSEQTLRFVYEIVKNKTK